MGRKFTDNTEVFPEIDDIVPGARPGRSPEEDVKNLAGDVPRIRLTDGRTAMQEVTSGTLSTSGWYTIAELGTSGNSGASGDFVIACNGSSRLGSIKFHATLFNGTQAKGSTNAHLEILSRGDYWSDYTRYPFHSVRIAKSDSVNNSGAKLQVDLDMAVSLVLNTQLSQNIANASTDGWELVTPYLDDPASNPGGTVILPDGVTVGTFLEAGELFDRTIGGATLAYDVKAYATTTTNLRLLFTWDEIPMQGTTLSFSYGGLTLKTGATTIYTFTGSETIGTPSIKGKNVYVNVTLGSAITAASSYDFVGYSFYATLS